MSRSAWDEDHALKLLAGFCHCTLQSLMTAFEEETAHNAWKSYNDS